MGHPGMRTSAIGMMCFLAIAGGTVVTATPSWATDVFKLTNSAPPGAVVTAGSYHCSSNCSLVGNPAFPVGTTLTFNVATGAFWGFADFSANIASHANPALSSVQQFFQFNGMGVDSGGHPVMNCLAVGTGLVLAEPNYEKSTCLLAPNPNSKLLGSRAADVRISSNRAVVKKGRAAIRVTSYAAKKFKVTERIVLRNANGKVIGTATKRVTTGKPSYLKVALPQGIRKKVRAGKHIVVNARVAHSDSTLGSGHRTTRLVLTRGGGAFH